MDRQELRQQQTISIDECHRKIERLASRIAKTNALDQADLLQIGLIKLWETSILKSAIGAMKEFARKERRERDAIMEYALCRKQLRRSCRSFDDLDQHISRLTEREQSIIKAWMLGMSLSEIGRQEGQHNKTIKLTLIKAFNCIAASIKGVSRDRKNRENIIDVSALFPVITKLLPNGIRMRDGRFLAYAGHAGKIYLGTFDSLEQAVEARRRWPAEFVTSPLDVL